MSHQASRRNTSDPTVLVLAGRRNPGVCKYCHKPIVWVTVASRPGRPARDMPFDPWPTESGAISTLRDDIRCLTFEVWPAQAQHTSTCKNQPKRDPTPARLRDSSRKGQGRFL